MTGEAPLIEEDDFFSSETDRLCEVLKQRMTLYEEEEHALRVMVREEVEERMLAGEEGMRVGKGGGEGSEHALRVMVREEMEERMLAGEGTHCLKCCVDCSYMSYICML